MSIPNPYQSPESAYVYNAEVAGQGGLWRKGNLLVMEKSARLPDRCVKSNVPTSRRLKRSLSWHHPAVFLAVLAHLFLYLILALALRKTATIYIGLSDDWFAKRRRAILIGWTLVLISVAMFVGGLTGIEYRGAGYLILLSLFVFLFGAIYGLVASRMVAPSRINDTHIWLKGVCPEFLLDLPEWPHSP